MTPEPELNQSGTDTYQSGVDITRVAPEPELNQSGVDTTRVAPEPALNQTGLDSDEYSNSFTTIT